jgi:hypothetical protein
MPKKLDVIGQQVEMFLCPLRSHRRPGSPPDRTISGNNPGFRNQPNGVMLG